MLAHPSTIGKAWRSDVNMPHGVHMADTAGDRVPNRRVRFAQKKKNGDDTRHDMTPFFLSGVGRTPDTTRH